MEGDRTNTTSSDDINNAIQRRTTGPKRRSTKGQWTPEEDEILRQAVQRFKGKNWKKIAECFKDRTDVQCLHRWQKVLNPELVKGPWSKEEDEVMIQLVNKYGPKKWSTIAQHLPGRIGKQCRERWHNHLNPTINREAWTQEEELALIRAHQIYGNKWAELTKFLPGRTDNAIKNHWNSSVKKKLDQYLASGLLQQFQGLPHVSHSNQSNASSSSKVQRSSENDVPNDRAELEEVSQCSQGSIIVGCSQSTSDMGYAVVHSKVESTIAEESSDKKDQSSNPASCSENYLTAPQEAAYPVPDVPHESGASSVYIENNSAYEWETSRGNDWQINSIESTKVTSQDLGQESADQYIMQYLNDSDDHQTVPFPLQDSMCFSNAIAVDEGFPSGININEVDGSADPLLFQSNYHICEEGHFASQSGYYSSSTDMLAASYSQQPSLPQQLLSNDGSLIFGIDPNQYHSSFTQNQEQEPLPDRHDGFNCVNESDKYPCDDCTKEQMPQANNASALIAINDLGSVPLQGVQTSVDKMPLGHDNQKDSGALCYEPPRFSSLEIPFLSCDLIQSGVDMLQEYSPLGTRQLWSSINRMWDSPSGDKSPDALLKSAAKSYTCTPSILKKRNRDLLSPLSEKRSGKKLEIDLKQKFSRLGVMFDEVGNDKALELSPSSNENRNTSNFIEDKENINPDLGQGENEDVKGLKGTAFSDDKLRPDNIDISAPEGEVKQHISGVDYRAEDEAHYMKNDGEVNASAEIVNQASGTLIEHDMNSLVYFSPDPFGVKSDRTVGLSTVLGNKYTRRLEAASNADSSSSETPFLSICSPHLSDKKDDNNFVLTRSLYSAFSSTPEVNKIGTSRNDVGVENMSIFGTTPFKRSFESPSGWKSPWFPNSYLLGSRGDADVTLEEIGMYLSPGDQSYDAIGLMKQLGEQTATAFANAQEVLGDETPQTILKKKCSRNQEADGENKEISRCQQEQHSILASNVVAERRMLDFSDCGTPGKGVETRKVAKAMSFSSPSSYLLKGCR